MARKRSESKISIGEKTYRSIRPPQSDFSGLDRINAIPEYSKKLRQGFLEDTMLKYSLMSERDIVAASKDKNITVLEKQVLSQLVSSIGKGKTALQATQITQDRIAGKAKNRTEHSGPDGAPITISNSKLVENMGSMSKEELEKIKKAVLMVKSVSDSQDEKQD